MVSSSRPSSPCTIRTRWAPRWRITPSMRSARLASASPTTSRRTCAGLAIGPRMLKTVGTPSSRRAGPAWRMAGWNRGAKQNAMPAASMQLATSSGVSSRRTPSASSRSAAPHADDAARLPCLHTGTPAPATTNEARVETLMVWLRSPPVPTMSTSWSRRGVVHLDQGGRRQHGVQQPAQLLDRLALHAQGDDKAGELGRGGGPFEDLAHGRPGGLGRQVAPGEKGAQDGRPAAELLERGHPGEASGRSRPPAPGDRP